MPTINNNPSGTTSAASVYAGMITASLGLAALIWLKGDMGGPIGAGVVTWLAAMQAGLTAAFGKLLHQSSDQINAAYQDALNTPAPGQAASPAGQPANPSLG